MPLPTKYQINKWKKQYGNMGIPNMLRLIYELLNTGTFKKEDEDKFNYVMWGIVCRTTTCTEEEQDAFTK